MILLFNGCSHTEGSQIPRTQTWANMVSKSIDRNSCFLHISYNENGQTIYNYLTDIDLDLFGDDLSISIAKSGKGNDAICFETIEAVEHLKEIHKKPNFVFVQWSGPSRRVYQLPYTIDTIEYINPYDSNTDQLLFEPLASKISCSYMKILQDYLKLNLIDYIFLPYTEFEETEDYKNINSYKTLDFDKIILSNGEFGKFRLNFLENNLAIDSVGHPSALANWIMAGKIVEKLNLNVIGFFDFLKITSIREKYKKIGSNIRIEYIQNTKLNKHLINSVDSQFKKANKSMLKIFKPKKLH